jgi:hypothetical protein
MQEAAAMTAPQLMPGQAPPLIDIGNTLLVSGLPATLQTGLAPLSDGHQAGLVTIRTPDVTLTLTVSREQADDWARMFAQLRDSLSGTGLIAAGPGAVLGTRP